MALDPKRTVAELEELRELTGDENGAQRVAWTDTWETARAWLRESCARRPRRGDRRGGQPVVHARRRDSSGRVLLGGHIDSVPNGGWLDGCLNVMAGVEVLRRFAAEGQPPLTVRLVDWADEEGARFGRSLFGSSAAAGLDGRPGRASPAARRDGIALPDALREHGVDIDRALDARSQLNECGRVSRAAHRAGARARVDEPPARRRPRHVRRRAAPGSRGRARRRTRLDADGQAPRRPGGRGEARARDPSRSRPRWGRAPCARPAVSSASPASSRLWSDGGAAARPAPPRRRSRSRDAVAREGCERALRARGGRRGRVGADLVDRADPLRRAADRAVRTNRFARSAGTSHRLPSGPLHDAAEVARAGVPTVMLFVQSLRGLSHTKLEDTKNEHLELSVQALDLLTSKTLERNSA